MKTKWLVSGVLGIMMLVYAGCEKDHNKDLNPSSAKLKQILLYSNLDSKDPIGIVEEYEYDETGRLLKSSTPMYEDGIITGTIKYNLYEYNSSNQLTRISNFNANLYSPTGYINLQNFIYSYSSDGKKIKESVENLNGIIDVYSVFEYKHNKLFRINKYDHDALESYVVNEYDNPGRLIKETFYVSDGTEITYTTHTYSGSQQIKSDIYISSNNTHYRSINRTFDANNNLITLESKELSIYSSMMSFVQRFKYYE